MSCWGGLFVRDFVCLVYLFEEVVWCKLLSLPGLIYCWKCGLVRELYQLIVSIMTKSSEMHELEWFKLDFTSSIKETN